MEKIFPLIGILLANKIPLDDTKLFNLHIQLKQTHLFSSVYKCTYEKKSYVLTLEKMSGSTLATIYGYHKSMSRFFGGSY